MLPIPSCSAGLCGPQFMQQPVPHEIDSGPNCTGVWSLGRPRLTALVLPYPRHTSVGSPGSRCDTGLSCGPRGKSRPKAGSDEF